MAQFFRKGMEGYRILGTIWNWGQLTVKCLEFRVTTAPGRSQQITDKDIWGCQRKALCMCVCVLWGKKLSLVPARGANLEWRLMKWFSLHQQIWRSHFSEIIRCLRGTATFNYHQLIPCLRQITLKFADAQSIPAELGVKNEQSRSRSQLEGLVSAAPSSSRSALR